MITKKWFALLLSIGLLLLVTASTLAAAGEFNLDWWTVDGGGGASSGSGYTLTGSIGQHDAGLLSGGSYVLHGGFFTGEVDTYPTQQEIFLPLVTND